MTETRKNTFFVEKKEFESVGDLIVFHTMTRTPVVEGSGVMLKKGVPSAKWEHNNDNFMPKEKLVSLPPCSVRDGVG